jgi:1-acylglycerone phosphate reductase
LELTLRLSVRVMTILAGPVVSGLMTRKQRSLPAGSRYLEINEHFESRTGHEKHGVAGMPTADFAQSVVNKINQKKTPQSYWIGPFKRVVWLLETLGLQSVWTYYFRRKFGLVELERSV